jgi:DNA-directed RNA polymerase specialized sigma24 family protein
MSETHELARSLGESCLARSRRQRVEAACRHAYRQLERSAGTALDARFTDIALATAWEEFHPTVLPASWESYLDELGEPNRAKLKDHLRRRAVSRTIDDRRRGKLTTVPLEREDGSSRADVELYCPPPFEERVLDVIGADARLKQTYAGLPTESLRRGFLGLVMVAVLGWPRRQAAELIQVSDSALGKYMSEARSHLRDVFTAGNGDAGACGALA